MSWIILNPLDVWLFRDGRPFDPGSGRRAESMFPPYPSVMQGAVRSKYLASERVDLTDPGSNKTIIQTKVGLPLDFSGQPLDLGGLQLRGPFLARQGPGGSTQLFFPQPADALSADKTVHTLQPASRPVPTPANIVTSLDETAFLLGFHDLPEKGESGLWLEFHCLMEYLEGKTVTGTPGSELFETENRFGIGLQRSQRVVEEGLLYEVEFVRPRQGVGLALELDGYPQFPASGLLQLGGESRAASFQPVQIPPWPTPPDPLPRRFKVFFATPAYFQSGWQPESWSRFFIGGPVTLRAAALSRYESLGGFDWSSNDHKPALRYLPAGSVYYFEGDGNTRLNPDLPRSAITDFGAQIGFGQIIIPDKEW